MLYYIIYKPFQVLSQFTDTENRKSLSSIYNLPKDVYPVGRLDADSEGLLILTNDNYLKTKILDPENEHSKTYLVQVDGSITNNEIKQLERGVIININGKDYKTKPCEVRLLEIEPILPLREPPIRFRKNIPTSWIEIILFEGKNRQIRKMTAKVGFPTLRLIRTAINNIQLLNMKPNEIKQLNKDTIYRLLNLY